MRVNIVWSLLPFVLSTACGGSVENGSPASDGGSDDAPASDASSDVAPADGPSQDAAGDTAPDVSPDAPPDGPYVCQPQGAYVMDLKACKSDAECEVREHVVNCCGTKIWVGVATAAAAAFGLCEHAWDASLPACGCEADPTTTETGAQPADVSGVAVVCTYWTMSGGVCMTRGK